MLRRFRILLSAYQSEIRRLRRELDDERATLYYRPSLIRGLPEKAGSANHPTAKGTTPTS